jgi:hypothetical protein
VQKTDVRSQQKEKKEERRKEGKEERKIEGKKEKEKLSDANSSRRCVPTYSKH